ncbi:hypothetical protein ACFVKB_42995 [Rhodococcus sp. NPDC127530]|uniref:hypothetical protein n=1 Tax=unclassified Rhodococcus (in: high G+C Gram-positive bacteria) TaxID=192944 RepID=UPI003635035B
MLLDAVADPWGLASWWLTPSARLPDRRILADLAGRSRPRSPPEARLVCAVLPY